MGNNSLGINDTFKGYLTLLNFKANQLFPKLDSQKNGKLDHKISVEDLQKAQNSTDSDVKAMANYILGNKDLMQDLGLNANDKKSKFSLDDAINLSVDGKLKASGDDLKNAANDYDKRNIAMNILSQHMNMIDKASDPNNNGKDDPSGTDGNFNTRDIANLAKSDKVPPEVKDAAQYVVDHPEILRAIDGATDKSNGFADGNFSWNDFKNAQGHLLNAGLDPKPYDDDSGANPTATGGITDPSKQMTEGDCVFLANVKSLSETPKGKQIIQDAITNNPDGTYTVKFKGAPDESITVTKDDLNNSKMVSGDTNFRILAAAADKHFKDQGGLDKNTSKTMNLLLGDDGYNSDHVSVYPKSGDANKDYQSIKQFLIDAAPHVGKDMALSASGGANDDGTMDWSKTNHEVSITKIQADPNSPGGGTVTYVNPWDSTKEHTVSIDDMAKTMKGGSGLDGWMLDGKTGSFADPNAFHNANNDAADKSQQGGSNSIPTNNGGTSDSGGGSNSIPSNNGVHVKGGTSDSGGSNSTPANDGGIVKVKGGTSDSGGDSTVPSDDSSVSDTATSTSTDDSAPPSNSSSSDSGNIASQMTAALPALKFHKLILQG